MENLIDEPWLMDKENRRNTLSALWGIVRAWGKAGEPKAASFGYKPRLGFERWGEIIAGLWGLPGLAINSKKFSWSRLVIRRSAISAS